MDKPLVGPGRAIRQKRSHKTYHALIKTGFLLLEQRELESITIAELAQAAGYSVGAFYSRFNSKDEFFDALIAHHLEERSRVRDRILATETDTTLINTLIDDLVTYYWKRRRFWRAALVRSIRDPDFWAPIREHGHEFADSMIARIEARASRPLSKPERLNVRFAFQVALGTINNTIINRPGPTFMGQAVFVDNLARTFRLVSDYDNLVSPPKRAAAQKPGRATRARGTRSPRQR
jgi:AcrR family transcriptional regulator